jgi:hypothetical protein
LKKRRGWYMPLVLKFLMHSMWSCRSHLDKREFENMKNEGGRVSALEASCRREESILEKWSWCVDALHSCKSSEPRRTVVPSTMLTAIASAPKFWISPSALWNPEAVRWSSPKTCENGWIVTKPCEFLGKKREWGVEACQK